MKFTRRDFLKQSAVGAVLAAGAPFTSGFSRPLSGKLATRVLGRSGVEVTCLALGTGTHGWMQQSNQTRIGKEKFADLALHAYESGIRFFDMADIYGTHTYFREALKSIPREKIVIMSKIWASPVDWLPQETPAETIDRFRNEIGTDYLDIVLIHCQTAPDWPEKVKAYRDGLSEARIKGIVRTCGISCHHLDAIRTAVSDDWTEVILARINHRGALMDDKPEAVMPVLKQAHDAGKGILGMKIFGCGDLTKEADRESSLSYVLGSGNVDAITIGVEKPEQIGDTIPRIQRILENLKNRQL